MLLGSDAPECQSPESCGDGDACSPRSASHLSGGSTKDGSSCLNDSFDHSQDVANLSFFASLDAAVDSGKGNSWGEAPFSRETDCTHSGVPGHPGIQEPQEGRGHVASERRVDLGIGSRCSGRRLVLR